MSLKWRYESWGGLSLQTTIQFMMESLEKVLMRDANHSFPPCTPIYPPTKAGNWNRNPWLNTLHWHFHQQSSQCSKTWNAKKDQVIKKNLLQKPYFSWVALWVEHTRGQTFLVLFLNKRNKPVCHLVGDRLGCEGKTNKSLLVWIGTNLFAQRDTGRKMKGRKKLMISSVLEGWGGNVISTLIDLDCLRGPFSLLVLHTTTPLLR